jgi:release factor glutamine methyltransferase
MPPPTPDAGSGYRPTLPADEIDLITRWHERAYREGLSVGTADQTFEYLGTSIIVPPDVMPITPMSHLLGEAVLAEAGRAERVLDMGTGSGVNGILAASRGADVLAVDINPKAVDAARANVHRNGLADRVEVRHSDVFDDVEGVFDLIVFDPPFRWFRPRSLFEVASTDEGYRAMTCFFRQAKDYLAPGGRILVFFGTSGDLGYLRQLIDEEAFTAEIVAHGDVVRDGTQVEYYTFRLATSANGRPN